MATFFRLPTPVQLPLYEAVGAPPLLLDCHEPFQNWNFIPRTPV